MHKSNFKFPLSEIEDRTKFDCKTLSNYAINFKMKLIAILDAITIIYNKRFTILHYCDSLNYISYLFTIL